MKQNVIFNGEIMTQNFNLTKVADCETWLIYLAIWQAVPDN